MTPEQEKFKDIHDKGGYVQVGDDFDYKIEVHAEKQEVVLYLKETDSDHDWLHNFLFIPWPLRLDGKTVWTTLGYATMYKSANNAHMDEFVRIAELYPGYKTAIRGWSLGSAMGKIAARHYLIRTGTELDEQTTYGDVKCWLNPFTRYQKKIKRCREYVTVNDFVTWCVPFFWRTTKCKVGPRFNIKKIFDTRYWHEHYEEYDYTEYEEVPQ